MEKKYKEIEKIPICKSKNIIITCKDNNLDADFEKAGEYLKDCKLQPKDNLHMELLFEETAIITGNLFNTCCYCIFFCSFNY